MRGFATPLIQLPEVPRELEAFKRALELHLNQQANAVTIRAHEIDMVTPLRDGGGLPVGALYVDQNNFVKMVGPEELWGLAKNIAVQPGLGDMV